MWNAEEWAQGATEKPMQEGWAEATIDEVMQRTSKTGNTYVSVRFQFDEYRSKLWENLNVCHPREDVREIAFRTLGNLCLACGFRSIRNPEAPDELQGQKLRVLIGRKGDDWTLRAFEPLRDTAPPAQKAAPTAVPAIADEDIPF